MLVDRAAHKVTLILSMSKNDPRALGCERSWGCVCDDGVHDPRACPFHAAVDLDDFIKECFPHDHLLPGFPLFPTVTGDPVTSDMMLAFIEELAVMMDEQHYTKAG